MGVPRKAASVVTANAFPFVRKVCCDCSEKHICITNTANAGNTVDTADTAGEKSMLWLQRDAKFHKKYAVAAARRTSDVADPASSADAACTAGTAGQKYAVAAARSECSCLLFEKYAVAAARSEF